MLIKRWRGLESFVVDEDNGRFGTVLLELYGRRMPELRRGVRRGRDPIDQQAKRSEHLVGNYIRTRAAVAKARAVEAAAAGKGKAVVVEAPRVARRRQRKGQVIVISEGQGGSEKERSEKPAEEEEGGFLGDKEGGGGVGKKEMMGDDSGGLSANKATGQEEEGSTAPFPERVSPNFLYCILIIVELLFSSNG